jgi:hypothetical protein
MFSSGNLNIYSKKLNGIHLTGGVELGAYNGIADFDSFGIMFGIVSQVMVSRNFALRGDFRARSNFGGALSFGISYYIR